MRAGGRPSEPVVNIKESEKPTRTYKEVGSFVGRTIQVIDTIFLQHAGIVGDETVFVFPNVRFRLHIQRLKLLTEAELPQIDLQTFHRPALVRVHLFATILLASFIFLVQLVQFVATDDHVSLCRREQCREYRGWCGE